MTKQCFKQKTGSHTIRIMLFSLLMLFVYVTTGYAQNMLQGVVTDVTGEPLPGVSVVVKGTVNGTTTDIEGKYVISVSKSAILEFSYIGMSKQEVKVNGQSTINVILKEDVESLDEVVVVGYGVQKKVHLTGSVAAISQKEMLNTTVSNISQTLVGKLPGLITQQLTGQPGSDGVSMLIRGYSSFSGSGSVLTLVDGVQRPLGQIDPNDVESVTILKDAASCAVYGMKAANGVILVTTKKGSHGKLEINYRGSLTLSHATTLPKMMNGTQYMQWYNLARELDGVKKPFFTEEEIAATYNGDPTDGFENTDWTSDLYKTTLMHQHNLSINGGNDMVRYFISGGYLHQDGIIKGNKNERSNFRSNIEVQATKNLKVSLKTAALIKDYYQPGAYSYGNQQGFSIFNQMFYSIPFVPKEYEGLPTSAYRASNKAANPIYGSANSGFSENRNIRFESSANVEYIAPFLKGLKANMFISWDWQDTASKAFAYAYKVNAYDSPTKKYNYVKSANLLEDGDMYQGDKKFQQLILRPTISYNNKFGLHDVGAMFLYEQMQSKSSNMSAQRNGFDLFDLPELTFGDAKTSRNNGSSSKSAYAAYVGRLNYAYADKYLAEFSFRYDGSYKFAKGHRWGFFPSVSLGWIVSQENFFKNLFPQIDYFKLRGSFGILGTDNVGAFLFQKAYSYSNNGAVFGSEPTAQGAIYNKVAYPNEELTWEKTKSYNLGFDLTAWSGLLGVSLDVFYKYTYDILQSVGNIYPPSLGGHYPSSANTGTFDNRGFEISLNHRNHIGDFNYTLTGNLSYAHNRILSKSQADNTIPWQSVLGSSLGELWGYKSLGLYQSEEDLKNSPQVSWNTPRVGDIKYADINGDGVINYNDRIKISRSNRPEMMFAFIADANYKGIDLSVQFQGAALCDKMLQYTWQDLNGVTDMTPMTRPWYANWDNAPLYLVENSWRPDHTNAEYPRLTANGLSQQNNAQQSDFWKRNGAYLRLKNVTLGYTFPKAWSNKLGLSNVRVYANGTNLLTLTDFKYLDPESTNVVTGYYPQQRTFSFGIDVRF